MSSLLDSIMDEVVQESGTEPQARASVVDDIFNDIEREAAVKPLPDGYEVIATTDNGGRVYQKPDGSRGFVGPNLSTEDPDAVARILEGATPADVARSGAQEDIIRQHPVAARGAKFVQGIPGVGQYVDEIIGGFSGPEAKQGVRALQGAMDEQRPGQATALEIAGGVTGAIPLAAAAGPAVVANAPPSLIGRAAVAAPLAAITGGIEGGVSGYGRGKTPEERRQIAGEDALFGAGTAAVVGAGAPFLGAGLKSLTSWLRSSDIGTIAGVLGMSKKAAKILRDQLGTESLPRAAQALDDVGDSAMLADAGPATQNLLDTSMQTGGKALRVGREAVEDRAAASGPKLRAAFDTILGAPKGVKTAARGIAKGSSKARQNAYGMAYNSPIDYAADSGRAIEAVLDRVPEGTMKSAIKEANEAMQEAGAKNLQIMASIADDGSVTFTNPLNIQQLDELKKALGAVAENSKDQFGRLTGEGLRASRLARDLRKATSDAVPVYGRAVRLGGDKIAEDNALSLGRSALERGTRLEDVVAAMDGASKAEKTAFKQGLREAIEDSMSNVRIVASDPNRDAREVRDAINKLSSRATMSKLDAAIGPAASARIEALIKEELPQLGTRAAVSRGSQTAIRTAGREAVDEALTPGVAGTIARGEPVGAGKRIIQVLTNTTPQADQATRAKVMAEISDALTKIRGNGAKVALREIERAMQGQPINEATARQIASVLTSGAALSADQAILQALEQ